MTRQPRRAHVYRVYQTDDSGTITDDAIWLDVLRIDRITFNEPRGSPDGESHNDRKYIVLWGDNTPDMGESPPAPTRRKYEKLTVTEPPEKGGDPDDPKLEKIVIPVIKRTWFTYRGSERGFGPQEAQWVFKNFAAETGRKSTPLRITNNDLNGKDADFFPAVNIGDPQPPVAPKEQVDWEHYAKAMQDGTVDDSQFVDVEVTDRFRIRFPPSPFDQIGALTALAGQMVTYVMKNRQETADDPIMPEDWFSSPPGTGTEAGPDTPGGLIRTDPFQCIVNVSWGGLAAEFYDGSD